MSLIIHKKENIPLLKGKILLYAVYTDASKTKRQEHFECEQGENINQAKDNRDKVGTLPSDSMHGKNHYRKGDKLTETIILQKYIISVILNKPVSKRAKQTLTETKEKRTNLRPVGEGSEIRRPGRQKLTADLSDTGDNL